MVRIYRGSRVPIPDESLDEQCPACGATDCEGHSRVRDPIGFQIVLDHAAGDHHRCYPLADCRVCEKCGGNLFPRGGAADYPCECPGRFKGVTS